MKLSVIIPTLNEEEHLKNLISHLQLKSGKLAVHEIIIADGGSSDHTVTISEKSGATVVHCQQRGRAAQMNAGASAATGDVLYFVHADTFPPENYVELIAKHLFAPKEAGCFTSIFDWPHPFLRFFNFFSRLPFWFCRGGGQTLFVRKKIFHKVGGYNADMKIMEEYDFISRIKTESSFVVIPENAITSARDYKVNGVYRLHLIYLWIFILYSTGASQEKMLKVVREKVKK